MTTPLTPEHLIAHARATARVDEDRHSQARLHSDDTLRSCGRAALEDLQRSSMITYPRAQASIYHHTYAAEYRRARTERDQEARG